MENRTVKYLLFFAVAAAAAFGIYRYAVPDKYEYWKNLITQDPKPDGVSEKEYREKLRAGYCWRDRKFYTAEELQQKAMVSFSGRLLANADALRTDFTTTLAGNAYTSEGCNRHKKACRVWFVPQDYTNEQWDKLFLAEKDPTDGKLLSKYPEKEIKQPVDLQNYLSYQKGKGFTLVFRGSEEGEVIYGSDCCETLNARKAMPLIKNNELITYLEDARVFPENDIPTNIRIEDYGVGNFYFNTREVIPNLYQDNKKHKTYQWSSSELLLMNNCGDVLWQPYYVILLEKD